jgi:hypothetical protein
MGLSILYIKLPDGSVRYGTYQDTNDVAFTKTFSTQKEQDDADTKYRETKDTSFLSHSNSNLTELCDRNKYDIVPVEVYCNYGNGVHWTALYNQNEQCLCDNLVWGYDNPYNDGAPDWIDVDELYRIISIDTKKPYSLLIPFEESENQPAKPLDGVTMLYNPGMAEKVTKVSRYIMSLMGTGVNPDHIETLSRKEDLLILKDGNGVKPIEAGIYIVDYLDLPIVPYKVEKRGNNIYYAYADLGLDVKDQGTVKIKDLKRFIYNCLKNETGYDRHGLDKIKDMSKQTITMDSITKDNTGELTLPFVPGPMGFNKDQEAYIKAWLNSFQ